MHCKSILRLRRWAQQMPYQMTPPPAAVGQINIAPPAAVGRIFVENRFVIRSHCFFDVIRSLSYHSVSHIIILYHSY